MPNHAVPRAHGMDAPPSKVEAPPGLVGAPPGVVDAPPSVVLVAAAGEPLADLLRGRGAALAVTDGQPNAVVQAMLARPDVVVLLAGFPGPSAEDLRRGFHLDSVASATTPILLLVGVPPSPEQRVAALRAGVWEVVPYGGAQDFEELWLKVQIYARARRNIRDAIADGLADPVTGVLNAPGLVRRGREVVALMARERAPVACVVFAVTAGAGAASAARAVARAARISDVVGMLDADHYAVIAPATDESGAVGLAMRVCEALRESAPVDGPQRAPPGVRVGFHVVGNVGYRPTDPVELLRLASSALNEGKAVAAHPWLKRHDAGWP